VTSFDWWIHWDSIHIIAEAENQKNNHPLYRYMFNLICGSRAPAECSPWHMAYLFDVPECWLLVLAHNKHLQNKTQEQQLHHEVLTASNMGWNLDLVFSLFCFLWEDSELRDRSLRVPNVNFWTRWHEDVCFCLIFKIKTFRLKTSKLLAQNHFKVITHQDLAFETLRWNKLCTYIPIA
jgi:hypothetical protein